MKYDKCIERTYAELDKYPIESFLIPGMSVYDVMDAIENEYNKNYENDDFFQGLIFNWIGTWEFMDYCRDKFGTKWYEKTDFLVNNN